MQKIVIFGTGQTADIIYQYFKHQGLFEIVAFTADVEFLDKVTLFDLPVIAFDKVRETYPPDQYKMFVAIGYADLNSLRAEKYAQAKQAGYQLVSYVDKNATIMADTEIGDNCCVMGHHSLQPYAKVGNNSFIWGGAVIAHHSTVGDHCWITSHVSIAGNTSIGDYCFIGMNASIGHMITVGEKCLIGAGALITKSVEDKGVYIVAETEKFGLDSTRFLKLSNMR